jgi:hypothetical protein
MSIFAVLGLLALFFVATSMGRSFLLLFATIVVMFFGYWAMPEGAYPIELAQAEVVHSAATQAG